MSKYGFRDGVFNVRNLQLEQKKLGVDTFPNVISSATLLKRMDASGTAAATLATTFDSPRAISVTNAMEATAERAMNLVIKGYDSEGNYNEEILSLSTSATGRTVGNVAFAQVTSVVGAVSSLGYGTYATVDIKLSDKFGLKEYCPTQDDVLNVDMFYSTSTGRSHTSSTIPAGFNSTYNTVDLSALGVIGSTVQVKYLSKFQQRR